MKSSVEVKLSSSMRKTHAFTGVYLHKGGHKNRTGYFSKPCGNDGNCIAGGSPFDGLRAGNRPLRAHCSLILPPPPPLAVSFPPQVIENAV